MNENLFIYWINRIQVPYSSKFPRTLLIMDQFSVHKLDAVKKLLNKSKTDILLIPPGFTSILQPLDIYINKPLKDQLRSGWENYMLEAEFNHNGKKLQYLIFSYYQGKISKISKQTLMDWIVEGWNQIPLKKESFFDVISGAHADQDYIPSKKKKIMKKRES